MNTKTRYGLSWIDENELYNVAKHVFQNIIQKTRETNPPAVPDPFSLALQAALLKQDKESLLRFEKIRSLNKSISNAIGLFTKRF